MNEKEKKSKLPVIALIFGALGMTSLVIFWFVSGAEQGHELNKQMRQEASVTEYQANPAGGDFTLQSADGPVSLSDFRGKLVLVFFGYTSCTTACPSAMNDITNAFSLLSPTEQEQVQAIFVSFDPQRDTLQKIKEYAKYFSPRIVGVSGSSEEVAAVAKQFGAIYSMDKMIESELGYGFSHTSTTYLIDQNGVYSDSFPFDLGYEVIADELKYRIANPPKAGTPPTPSTEVKKEEQSFEAAGPTEKPR